MVISNSVYSVQREAAETIQQAAVNVFLQEAKFIHWVKISPKEMPGVAPNKPKLKLTPTLCLQICVYSMSVMGCGKHLYENGLLNKTSSKLKKITLYKPRRKKPQIITINSKL